VGYSGIHATIRLSNANNIVVFSPRCAPVQPTFRGIRGDSVPRFFFCHVFRGTQRALRRRTKNAVEATGLDTSLGVPSTRGERMELRAQGTLDLD